VSLEVEVSEQEMRRTALRVVERGQKRRTEQEKKEIQLKIVYKMLILNLKKDSDPRASFLQVFKCLTLQKRWE